MLQAVKMTTIMKRVLILAVLSFYPLFCMGQKVDNTTVSDLSLGRYLGMWYEIARFDHGFERGISHSTANYTLDDDGFIKVVNSGLKDGKIKISTGKAKLTDVNGLLRVSFFGPFYSDYRVLMVTDDYNYALVGSGSPKYLWILSRVPYVHPDVLDKIVDEAVSRGYDPDKLLWVNQNLRSEVWY